jgi:Cu-Zn family superoxide dismutase
MNTTKSFSYGWAAFFGAGIGGAILGYRQAGVEQQHRFEAKGELDRKRNDLLEKLEAKMREDGTLKFKKTYRAVCVVGPNGKPCASASSSSSSSSSASSSSSSSSSSSVVSGEVKFEQSGDSPTRIAYTITGLSPGPHGFHIHESADFSNGCISAGPHYNPHKMKHGGPDDDERHAGDLGNIVADAKGVAKGAIKAPLVHLAGEFSVIGRSIMVHADPDDLGKGGHELSHTTGNAGARLACGEIKAVDP